MKPVGVFLIMVLFFLGMAVMFGYFDYITSPNPKNTIYRKFLNSYQAMTTKCTGEEKVSIKITGKIICCPKGSWCE